MFIPTTKNIYLLLNYFILEILHFNLVYFILNVINKCIKLECVFYVLITTVKNLGLSKGWICNNSISDKQGSTQNRTTGNCDND